ncbi:MAG: cadmium-translocating P-type ATPase [Lachnospiraceae bacterium]|nr:cadmium-translocating P-type ATPase [Lachnospiraceae bacterium]
MTRKQKKNLTRIIISLALFLILLVCDKTGIFTGRLPVAAVIILYLLPYGIIGYDILLKAAKNIRNGHIFDENFLMTVATIAAFCIGEYSEALAVMIFYQVGEFFQSYAVGKSRQSIAEMMSIAPEYANIEEDGELSEVDPDEVPVGSCIVIKPGERIPLDGTVLEGDSFIDTSALTGESVPKHTGVGDEVISGCVNGQGTLRVRVTKAYEDSTVAKILELVENAGSKKAHLEKFITRFAKYYTPAVTIGAALIALLPPLLLGQPFGSWIHRACIFLIVSCPCALVISVPMGFFGGIGAASKIGVLVKGSNYLEAISQLKTIVFDKTGTLTKGEFKVTSVFLGEDDTALTDFELPEVKKLLEAAAHAEGYSTHPIALSIQAAYGEPLNLKRLENSEELAGRGIRTRLDGKLLMVGNHRLMEEEKITFRRNGDFGTVVYVATEEEFLGSILITDTLKDGAKEALSEIRQAGAAKTVMLTGDRKEAAEAVASELGVDEYHAQLLPADKVALVEDLMNTKEGRGKLAFVGDGINDAPVLMRSDIGIAMGSLGSDAAIEAADIVLMDDDIRKIASVIKIAGKTLRIVKQNVAFALTVKALVLLIGALGMANLWEAVFADVGVSVIAILNSMRALKTT